MVNEIIVDVSPGEIRVGILEDKELAEIHIERTNHQGLVGNIYRGKVSSVLPGMQAAFIDIGYEKNAFLYVGDAVPKKEYSDDESEVNCNYEEYNISDILKVGQEITVQVIKEPIGTKGPRVSTHITLPGRNLVLLPNADYIGISRRIENDAERQKLKKIAEKLKPQNMGLIVRTVSEGKEESDFVEDVSFLIKLWAKIKESENNGPVPRCIHRDINLIYRSVRDLFTWDVNKFIINSEKEYSKVLELVEMISPLLKSRVELFQKDYKIFDYYQIESKIERALSRKVWLKCGGYIIIDKTEALTVIDVNTGKFVGESNLEETVLKTNIEATREIAKQLRLRDIGGIVIIDFIDMNNAEHQQLVLDSLKQSLKDDRTKTIVLGMTELGLVEMTRKKIRQELSTVISCDCPICDGAGRVYTAETNAMNILREVREHMNSTSSKKIRLEVHPTVAHAVEENIQSLLEDFTEKKDKKIKVTAVNDIRPAGYRIKDIDTD
ncbi:Rne/Rng family ribonuclease [Ruminiclostridium cellulolyticum]|uniref:Ribonuclease G n=1 Tax=Ruminiclostridium cellulolyticum (strain ATCC 35319 / DSM 5812 / JCM 6584 / H10) TaxID=394503 RepID=B8I175_RUMCH|nr:Rne/Rng family ribonuclease [Ruminiclostridium cellulolyticum]ACL75673.1 ribonuclease, Rne/Rng family [Ruminiclostridium cellulolyticum H10]